MKHVGLSILLLLSAMPAIAQINGCVADFIIVGNGTAGATLAGIISDPIGSVLVLERGPNYATDPNILSADPTVFFTLGSNSKYSEISVALTGNIFTAGLGLPYTEGRMWGGSSAHNYLIAVRGTPDVYNEWAVAAGDTSWSYNNLLPLMKFMEHYTPNGTTVDLTQRGTAGPLFITQLVPTASVQGNLFALALGVTEGVPYVPDYNDPNAGNLGYSSTQQYITPTTPATRSFSVTAFEPQTAVNYTTGRGIGRPLNIVSLATVTRVLFSTVAGTPTAIGVEYILNGNPEHVYRAFARKKVILAAGAIHTPAILQRSGIGDSALLNSLGIPVIVDNPLVGTNLQTHYGPVLAYNNTGTTVPVGISMVSFHDLTVGGTSRTVEDLIVAGPNYALGFFPQPQVLVELGVTTVTTIVGLSPQLVRNSSRGTVAITDLDPTYQPQINFNLYAGGQTGPDAVAAIEVLRELRVVAGFPTIFPSLADYNDLTDTRLYQAAQNVWIIQDHACGTCALGDVVDNNLNVLGVNNLMIADLSIAPIITTGNTAYPAYVIGLKAATILGAPVPPVA